LQIREADSAGGMLALSMSRVPAPQHKAGPSLRSGWQIRE